MMPDTSASRQQNVAPMGMPAEALPQSAVPGETRRPIVAPYRVLDAWRGFAALWVVLAHSSMADVLVKFPALREVPLFAFSIWGGLGVPIFFVISGYCIANAACEVRARPNFLKRYAWARARRIYPPYYAAMLLAVLLSIPMAMLAARGLPHSGPLAEIRFFEHGPLYYLAALTLMQDVLHQSFVLSVFWTLAYEVSFYVIVGLFLWITARAKSPQTLLVCLHVLTVVCLIGLLLSGGRATPRPDIWPLIRDGQLMKPFDLWPQFGLGVLVYHALRRDGGKIPLIFLGLTACLIATIAVLQPPVVRTLFGGAHGILGYPSDRTRLLLCLSVALLLLAMHRFDAALMKTRAMRALAWVGTFSYSLYLTHLLVVPLVRAAGYKIGMGQKTFWILLVLQVVTALLFARGFFVIAERPFLRRRAENTGRSPVSSPLLEAT